MTHATEMLNAHPGTAAIDADVLIECIEACFDCSQACSVCAEAGVGEEMVSHMRRCMTMCLNCSDQCATTGRLLSRQTESESAMARAVRIMCAVVTVFLLTTPSRAPARNRSRQCAMGFCARGGCEGSVAGGGVERRARSSGARGRGPAAGSGLGPSG
jgi:hypothetical protein